VQFRFRAYRLAAASISITMQWSFTRGMPYAEVLQAFKQCKVLPTALKGTELQLTSPAVLMAGAVTAIVPVVSQPKLNRDINFSMIRRQSIISPSQSRKGDDQAGGSGEQRRITPPALLEPGSYPIDQDCTVC
jgi:hypothetical protein